MDELKIIFSLPGFETQKVFKMTLTKNGSTLIFHVNVPYYKYIFFTILLITPIIQLDRYL